jgi:hypothetical protein
MGTLADWQISVSGNRTSIPFAESFRCEGGRHPLWPLRVVQACGEAGSRPS